MKNVKESLILTALGTSSAFSATTAEWNGSSSPSGGVGADANNWQIAHYPGGPGSPADENTYIRGLNGGDRVIA